MNPVQNSMILFLFLFTYMAQARFIPDESTTTTTTTTTISDRSTPTSDNFANSPAFLNNEPAQYCGETLYYVVEYYCVYVKGTSVYVPEDGDDDSVNVIGDGKKRRNLESSGNYIL